jgi:hypothetical protein
MTALKGEDGSSGRITGGAYGVWGDSDKEYGVLGTNSSGYGVCGASTNGIGVYGYSAGDRASAIEGQFTGTRRYGLISYGLTIGNVGILVAGGDTSVNASNSQGGGSAFLTTINFAGDLRASLCSRKVN